jgi:predicted branched-subunit amino acid permease/branched-subunit amino acid transport protein
VTDIDDRPAERTRARPVRDGMALGLAVGISGIAFGAAAVGSGMSVAQACVLSLLAFTGASQFALAGAVATGGGLIGGAASAILLGSRNALYGLRLADLLPRRGVRRLLAAHGVIDETTAVTLAQPDTAAARRGFLATFATIYVTWNLTTLLGALGAGRIGSPQSLGIDVIGPAAFLALIWPRLRAGRTERAVGLAGALIALAATPVLPPGVPVILAATAGRGMALPGAGGGMTGIWVAVLVTAAGCYALKLTGLIVPRGVLDNPRVRRFAELVPIALLAALVAVQTFGAGQSLSLDPARLAGLGAAVAALLLRAPFLVVIVVAAGTAAALRALGVA